jgi:Fe-S cluster assembly ATPase SufC
VKLFIFIFVFVLGASAGANEAQGLLKFTVNDSGSLRSETIKISKKATKLNLNSEIVSCEASASFLGGESEATIVCKHIASGNIFTVLSTCDTGKDVAIQISKDSNSQFSPLILINARCTTKQNKT